jgi:hypothetical protein
MSWRCGLCWMLVGWASAETPPSTESQRAIVIRALAKNADLLSEVPFREVIKAAAGHEILPFDAAKDPLCKRIEAAVTEALRRTLELANTPRSPLRQKKRINETSKWFEDQLCEQLAATPGFTCEFPQNAEGKVQRTGYPDLRLVHQASGRVTYLDPKVHAEESATSSLRTFYYQPVADTGKVLEDAHHLILGISHVGEPQKWTFTGFKLVDVGELKVSLKAEFDAGNDELYSQPLLRAQGP